MRNKKFIFANLGLICLIFINGCFSHPVYPQTWSSLSEFDKCPNLQGYYSDKGDDIDDVNRKPSLNLYLIGDAAKDDKDEVKFIKISQNDNDLLIEAYSDMSVLRKRVVHFKPSDCKNGFLKLDVPNPEGGVYRGNVVGYEWDSFQVSKAIDGSLVLRHDSSALGIVLLIPIAGSKWHWSRFSPINDR